MEGILIKYISFILVLVIALSLFCINAFAVSDSAAASVVINADTLEVIYQNNANVKRSMASTTKIMTALLLAESGRLGETVRCTAEAVNVEGSAMGLSAGDEISGRDLLFGLMLMSGNDAANVTAHFLAGNTEAFAKMMNEKAKTLGLSDTHFVTPSGLDAQEHYTTALDLATLTAYALENPDFRAACSAYTATVSFGAPPVKYTVTNHNRLLKEYEGCIGVKTGFTKKSGRCLVSAAERDGKRIVAVTLYDRNDWKDHKSMLDYGFEKLGVRVLSCEKESLSVPVLGSERESVPLYFHDMPVGVIPENAAELEIRFLLPRYITAPIEAGQTVGKAVVLFKGKEVRSTDITVSETALSLSPKPYDFEEELKNYLLIMFKSFRSKI